VPAEASGREVRPSGSGSGEWSAKSAGSGSGSAHEGPGGSPPVVQQRSWGAAPIKLSGSLCRDVSESRLHVVRFLSRSSSSASARAHPTDGASSSSDTAASGVAASARSAATSWGGRLGIRSATRPPEDGASAENSVNSLALSKVSEVPSDRGSLTSASAGQGSGNLSADPSFDRAVRTNGSPDPPAAEAAGSAAAADSAQVGEEVSVDESGSRRLSTWV